MKKEENQTDAVAMTRRIRDAHYEQLKNATPEERIRFFREKARRVYGKAAERLSRDEPPACEPD